MNRIQSVLICILLLSSNSAFAQLRVGPILDAGPLHFSAGLDVTVSQVAHQIAYVKTTAFVALHDAQAVIDAMVPQLAQRAACDGKRPYGGKISGVRLDSNQANMLAITVSAYGQKCGTFGVGSDMNISVPLNVVVAQGNRIHLKAGPVTVTPTGFLGTALNASGFVPEIERTLGSQVDQFAGQFDKWANSQLDYPLLQKQIKEYNLKIDSASVDLKNGVLSVNLGLSGQVPIATLDNRLKDF